jgi:hypothetical protein
MLPEVKLLREAQRRRQEIVERRVKAMQVFLMCFLCVCVPNVFCPSACQGHAGACARSCVRSLHRMCFLYVECVLYTRTRVLTLSLSS